MERKNIAFIISSLSPGGAERVVSNLANSLIDTHNVTIIVLHNDKPFYKLDSKVNLLYCREEYQFKKSAFKSICIQLEFIFKIYYFIKTYNIDIAIGFMTTTNIYSIIASKFARVPCIVSERIHPDYSSLSMFWSKVRRRVYRHCYKLVVQTEAIKEYYQTFLDDDQLQVIKNPLSQSLLHLRDSEDIKERIILSVGRLSNQKNHTMLIQAFYELKNSDWKLHIIGEGKNKLQYKRLIASLELENQVKLIGNVTNIHDYYNTSSIFAFTSNFEGFPNALTEAMAFGLPCVSTDCPSGPSELIQDGKNGYLISVGDKTMLIEKLSVLINQPHLRKTIGLEAKISTTIYESNHIVSLWEKLINTALKK